MTSLLADALSLSRWQFATTTLYHFTFVPLTLGLAPLLAIMQTLYHRTNNEKWNRLVYQPVDYTTLEENEDITELKQAVACAGGACEIA